MRALDRKRLVEEYALGEAEHELILQDLIEMTRWGRRAVGDPVCVVLGGQPASGKSNLISWCEERYFPDGNVCVINGDEFRGAHPKSDEIHRLHEELYAEITDADVRSWTRDVLEHCIQGGYNIIFEGTMRTDAVCDTVRRMTGLGYRVVAGVMAVPYHVSYISIHLRYLNELRSSGHGRQVSVESHDAAYSGMPDTVGKLVSQGYCSEFVVFTRSAPEASASFVALTDEPLDIIKDARSTLPDRRGLAELDILCGALFHELKKRGQSNIAKPFLARWKSIRMQLIK